MARKIRFALEMDNGTEVRTLEELRNNFSLEKVLQHIASGKFDTWLRDRYYDEVADSVKALDPSDSEYNKKLCRILDVNYDTSSDANYEKAEEHNRKLSLLKAVSDEQEYINNVDRMAFEQDDIYDLLDEGKTTIYLCGERFSIPLSKCGIAYIGVNNPIAVIDSKEPVNWEEKNISFTNITFNDEYHNVDKEKINKPISDIQSAQLLIEKGDELFFKYGGHLIF